jgi:hypothetical protein
MADPHGNCIITSAVVCSKVWNTSNNGSTACPATVTSCNGWSHTGASWENKSIDRNIFTCLFPILIQFPTIF